MTWKTMDTPPAQGQKVLVIWPDSSSTMWMATYFNHEHEGKVWVASNGRSLRERNGDMSPLFWQDLPPMPVIE